MKALVFALVLIVIALFAALSTQVGAAEPNWPASLTLATASPGGTYHAYGTGLAKILTRVLGLPVVERTTQGPSENIQLIETGEAQIGFVTMGAALEGWNGTGDWTNGTSYRAMRAIFPMYDTPFHFIVSNESNVRSVADITHKRVGVGPRGGTAGIYIPKFLATLKMEASLVHGPWEDLASQLEHGEIDVIAAAVGAPFPAIAALERKKKARFVPLSRDDIVALRLAMPELTPSTIPAGTYPSLLRRYDTVGLYNFAIVHKDLPSGLVYQIVDAVFANHDELVATHPAAAATIPANFVHNTFLPYHSGATRYYSDRMVSGVVRGD